MVVLDVMFVSEIPTLVRRMYLFILLEVSRLKTLLEMKQNKFADIILFVIMHLSKLYVQYI